MNFNFGPARRQPTQTKTKPNMKATKIITGLALAMGLALFTLDTQASDWITSTINVDSSLTNIPGSGAASFSITSNSIPGGTAFAIPQNVPWSLMIPNTGGATGASPTNGWTTYGFNLSQDKVTWSTTLPLTLTVTQNGSNTVCVATNYTSAIWSGYAWARLDQVKSNETNGVATYYFKVSSFQ